MKIKTLAEKSGLSIHTLRYYEKEGLTQRTEDSNGVRNYRKRLGMALVFSKNEGV